MAPILVMNPKNQLGDIIQDKERIITDILCRLKKLLDNNKLDENIKLIGIANNNMLGVFQLVKIDGGYECHRIYIEGDTVIVSDFGYPVSNMGNVRASLDCDMEYILPIATLSSL